MNYVFRSARLAAVVLLLTAALFIGCESDDDSDSGSSFDIESILEEVAGSERYNSLVFAETDVSNDVKYGSNTTQGGSSVDLKMDIYQPKGDTESSRPLIIFAHGGAFTIGDKLEFKVIAEYFARSGYVVASINYRLLDLDVTEARIKQAVLDGVFDMKAAVRFFTKDADTDNTYKIDKSKIFIGGYSAGSFIALHYGYVTADADIQRMDSTGALLQYVTDSGGLEGNSGNAGYATAVKGILNVSGALLYADYVDNGEPVLFSVHGKKDDTVPYERGEANGYGVISEGSGLIHPVCTNVGVENKLVAVDNGTHLVFLDKNILSWIKEMRTFVFNNL